MFDRWIRDFATWTPHAPAVITPTQVTPYAEFDADIDRFGWAIGQLGVSRDTGVVSVCLDNPYLTLVATAALTRLGVTSSPYNDHGADLRLIERETAGGEAPGPRRLMLDAGWQATMRAADPRPLPALAVDPAATVRVMLSSGTTRAARRVALSWRRIEAGNHAALASFAAGRRGVFAPLSTVESMLGFTMMTAAWSLGAAVTGGIHPPDMPALMESWPDGVAGGTPAHLLTMADRRPAGFRPKPGWRLISAGSPLPPGLARQARLLFTPDVSIIYGATESTLNAYGRAEELELDPGLVGLPPSGTVVRLVQDDGTPAPDGEAGEILLRSERMSNAYLGDAEGTAERFVDGWFLTRDLGRRLPDGRIVLEGRTDDRMNLGGRKLMPVVLEQAALACPGIRDAAAFTTPGPRSGLDVCWLAVAADPDFDRSRLAPHLAAYPHLPPPRFAWVNEIPRNAMGKIERSKLRDRFLAAIGKD